MLWLCMHITTKVGFGLSSSKKDQLQNVILSIHWTMVYHIKLFMRCTDSYVRIAEIN